MPIKTFPFVPGGIIEDQDIPFPGGDDTRGCFIKEDLENIRIAVTCFNSKELTCSRADSTENA